MSSGGALRGGEIKKCCKYTERFPSARKNKKMSRGYPARPRWRRAKGEVRWGENSGQRRKAPILIKFYRRSGRSLAEKGSSSSGEGGERPFGKRNTGEEGGKQ